MEDVGPLKFIEMISMEMYAKCLESFYETVLSGNRFLDVFQNLISFNVLSLSEYALLKPGASEVINELKELTKEFKTDGQTFALKSETSHTIIWSYNIAMPKEFRFLKDGSNRNYSDKKGVLVFDVFLPFNNQHHDDRNCMTTKDLPKFYKTKGNKGRSF